MPVKLDNRTAGFDDGFVKLLNMKRETSEDVGAIVSDILSEVRIRGDAALQDYSLKFDRIDISEIGLEIISSSIDEAEKRISDGQRNALILAQERITSYHSRHKPLDDEYTDEQGVDLGARWTAIEAAGIYVPGGTASYPSSVLMNVIPAKVAGVDQITMVVPTPDGVINPLVLVAARLAGVDRIYRIGGAQAVAALAFGTETIKPVDIIIGPGNAYVAAAKRQVFGHVGIDMIAGPSEVLIVADQSNNPAWIAADLLAQAEHDPSAQSILITDNQEFAASVEEEIALQINSLQRAEIAQQSWQEFGAIIQVTDLDEAPALIDRLAPEHLELAVEDPRMMFSKIRNAGAVFLGRYSPEAIGDYIGGPNHVLPTARSARFSSGLSVLDFMKRTTYLACDAGSLAKLASAAETLAESEGLDAHKRSVSIRLNSS